MKGEQKVEQSWKRAWELGPTFFYSSSIFWAFFLHLWKRFRPPPILSSTSERVRYEKKVSPFLQWRTFSFFAFQSTPALTNWRAGSAAHSPNPNCNFKLLTSFQNNIPVFTVPMTLVTLVFLLTSDSSGRNLVRVSDPSYPEKQTYNWFAKERNVPQVRKVK